MVTFLGSCPSVLFFIPISLCCCNSLVGRAEDVAPEGEFVGAAEWISYRRVELNILDLVYGDEVGRLRELLPVHNPIVLTSKTRGCRRLLDDLDDQMFYSVTFGGSKARGFSFSPILVDGRSRMDFPYKNTLLHSTPELRREQLAAKSLSGIGGLVVESFYDPVDFDWISISKDAPVGSSREIRPSQLRRFLTPGSAEHTTRVLPPGVNWRGPDEAFSRLPDGDGGLDAGPIFASHIISLIEEGFHAGQLTGQLTASKESDSNSEEVSSSCWNLRLTGGGMILGEHSDTFDRDALAWNSYFYPWEFHFKEGRLSADFQEEGLIRIDREKETVRGAELEIKMEGRVVFTVSHTGLVAEAAGDVSCAFRATISISTQSLPDGADLGATP